MCQQLREEEGKRETVSRGTFFHRLQCGVAHGITLTILSMPLGPRLVRTTSATAAYLRRENKDFKTEKKMLVKKRET